MDANTSTPPVEGAGTGGQRALDALIAPLMLPGRVLAELEAISEAVRSLPGFEHEIVGQILDLKGDVQALRVELASTRALAAELRALVGDAVEHLPGDDESRGPMARARDAITGAGA